MMTSSLSHQARVNAHVEEQKARSALRAKAIFDLVSTLAQARRFVTEESLQVRISAALLNSHLAFNGEFHFQTEGGDVIPIARKAKAS